MERFGRQGYRATSVSEIARAAGLTQATAYAYFESKQALFVAALDADATALVLEAGERTQGVPATEMALRFLVELHDGVEAHPLTRRVLAGQETAVTVFPELMDLPAIHLATEVIVAELGAAQQRGEVRTDIDPEMIGAGIEGIVLSILVATVQLGDLSSDRRQAGVVAAFAAMLDPLA
jgi:AcrR family transcriptional regulator